MRKFLFIIGISALFLFWSVTVLAYTQKDAYNEYCELLEKAQSFEFFIKTTNMFAVLERQFLIEDETTGKIYKAYIYKVFDEAILKCEDLPPGWKKFKNVPTYPIIVFREINNIQKNK